MKKVHKNFKPKKRKGIQAKISRTVLTIVLISLIGLGIITSFLNYQNTFTTLEQSMTEAVELAAERAEWELTAYKRVVIDLGTVARMSNDSYTDEDKQELIDQKVREYDLARGKLISADGISHIDGTDYNDREYFKKSMQGEVWITEPMIAKATGKMSIMISAPVWKGGIPDTEIVGVVFVVPQETFLNDIVESIQISEGSSSYMLDAKGNTIAHADMELVSSQSNTQNDAKTDKSLEPLAELESKMVAGEHSFGRYKYDGVQKLMTYAPVEGTNGWSIAITAPIMDFMQGTIVTILLTIVIIIVAIIIATWRTNKLAGSIAKPLQKLSERLITFSQGDLSESFPQADTDDEVADMVVTASDMAENLIAIINDCKYRLNEMAKGDYTVESAASEKYVGEFAGLDTAVNDLTSNMNDTLHQIGEAAEQVSAGAGNLAEGAQNLAEGATEQAGAVQELLATVSNLAEDVEKTSERINDVHQISMKCAKEANKSRSEMKNMVTGMERMNETSQKIESIISEIEEIASQTNLLSLNASIEAARAGEAGKGFAVVADQIGKLADESARSAVTTRELILNSIQEIKEETLAAETAAVTIDGVVEDIDKLATAAEEINEFTQNQAEAMKQTEAGVNQISEVVQTNSATAEESSATSEELSAEAVSLDDMVKRFKLKS